MSDRHLRNIEKGNTVPKLDTVIKLGNALNINLGEFPLFFISFLFFVFELRIHDLFAEGQDFVSILLFAPAENAVIERIIDDDHDQADHADYNSGEHRIGDAEGGGKIGHDQAHAAPHDQCADTAEDVCESIGRTLDFGIERTELLQIGALLLLGVRGADVFYRKLLIVSVHCEYLFHHFLGVVSIFYYPLVFVLLAKCL